ncbi:uncharacterized protein LOC134239859 [Saccostrea cucullata]|uniref:uncharacterized protein LOC134239859 n=1 Tax=Saccostrea cuccullata TaxID=36930 RepID=UPI002ED06121
MAEKRHESETAFLQQQIKAELEDHPVSTWKIFKNVKSLQRRRQRRQQQRRQQQRRQRQTTDQVPTLINLKYQQQGRRQKHLKFDINCTNSNIFHAHHFAWIGCFT